MNKFSKNSKMEWSCPRKVFVYEWRLGLMTCSRTQTALSTRPEEIQLLSLYSSTVIRLNMRGTDDSGHIERHTKI